MKEFFVPMNKFTLGDSIADSVKFQSFFFEELPDINIIKENSENIGNKPFNLKSATNYNEKNRSHDSSKSSKRKQKSTSASTAKRRKRNKCHDIGDVRGEGEGDPEDIAVECEKSRCLDLGDEYADPQTRISALTDHTRCDISNWIPLSVPFVILRALAERKFHEPTEIQRLCLPSAIKGRLDIVGAAETGSGKTLAYAIPVVYGCMKQQDADCGQESHVKALILVPTRELAVQVKSHIDIITKYTSIKVVCLIGGRFEERQKRELRRTTPSILVATPGRLWQFVEEDNVSILSSISFLVVDETDRMLETGHFKHMRLLLNKINSLDPVCVSRRQNFIFSATLSVSHMDTASISVNSAVEKTTTKLLAEEKLKAIFDMVGIRKTRKVVDLTVGVATATRITEAEITGLSDESRDQTLYYFLLQHPGRTIVFCNSVDCCTRLGHLFTELLHVPVYQLHSRLEQRARFTNFERFSSSGAHSGVLVATDIAARGLDIPCVQHVIHYNVARNVQMYVHRSGRTARFASEGLSLCLVVSAEMKMQTKLIRQLNKDGHMAEFDIDHDIFTLLAPHVSLARKISLAEHRLRRESKQTRWRDEMMRKMELNESSESCSDEDHETISRLSKKSHLHEIRAMKNSLQEMIRRRNEIWAPCPIFGSLKIYKRNSSALNIAKSCARKPKHHTGRTRRKHR